MYCSVENNFRTRTCLRRQQQSKRGVAYLFSLIMLALMATMSVSMLAGTNINLRRNQHMKDALAAQLSAESGLEFMRMSFTKLRMPEGTTSSTLMAKLAEGLADVMDGTANINGQSISYSDSAVSMPTITVGDTSFLCTITELAPDSEGYPRCRLTSVGICGLATRKVCLDMKMVGRAADAFNYAIASKGGIYVSGNAEINGMNAPSEASVLSINEDAIAISLGGSASIGGHLYLTSNDEESLHLTGGGLSVGGESDINEILENNVHWLQEPPDFPQLNLSPFEALAQTATVIDSNTDTTAKDMVFNNVRIAAGTNPEFKNDTVINGLLYIESPNVVTFKSKAVLNAIVVTEDATGSEGENHLDFKAQVTVPGVDALPDTAEFQDIKALTGSAILAPGFSVQFRGHVNSINGTIAADQFSFLGNSNISGDVTGTIIGLSSKDLIMQGNATILVNKDDSNDLPAGFVHFKALSVIKNTYSEGN